MYKTGFTLQFFLDVFTKRYLGEPKMVLSVIAAKKKKKKIPLGTFVFKAITTPHNLVIDLVYKFYKFLIYFFI